MRLHKDGLKNVSTLGEHYTNVTPYFNVSTNYRWSTKLSFNAGFRRDQNASAYGAVYEVDRLNFSLGYQFTERLSSSLGGIYSLSNQSSQTITSKYNYHNINSNLSYQITEKLSVSPGYSYSGRENLSGAIVTSGSTHAHMASMQFSYTYPIYYQK